MWLPPLSQIKTIRKKLGLTQKQLATLASVSQSLIAKIEYGSVQPNYEIAKKIFEELSMLEYEKDVKASELMTPNIKLLTGVQKIGEASKLMLKHGISQVPVIEGEKIVGTITESDVIEAQISAEARAKHLLVREIMGPALPTVDINMPRSALATIMCHSQAVLVLRKGKLVGIITRSDLLK